MPPVLTRIHSELRSRTDARARTIDQTAPPEIPLGRSQSSSLADFREWGRLLGLHSDGLRKLRMLQSLRQCLHGFGFPRLPMVDLVSRASLVERS
jgi:hypothetical protein